MKIYKVYYYPHAILKKKCTSVEKFTPQLKEFIQNLIETAYQFEGGGIAAPQVGISKRIFISDFSSTFQKNETFEKKEGDFLVFDAHGKQIETKFPLVFINPEILVQENPIITDWEGCLSFPDADSFRIPRFHKIEIKAQNENGEFFSVKTTHLYAAVNFLHEVDHLDGITMIDRWEKSAYDRGEILDQIQNFINSSTERKRLKKLNLADAQKFKFDFLY